MWAPFVSFDLLCKDHIFTYGKVCRANLSKRWDEPITDPDVTEMVTNLFHSIVKVKETLLPMPRSWVPE